MLLAVDIGNTNITCALFKDEEIINTYRLTTKLQRTSDEYGFMILSFISSSNIKVEDIEDVIIASVVPKIMHSFTNSIRKYLKKEPIMVGPGMKTGIKIHYDNPKEVGADRIVDAVGAYYKYGGEILVIDFGTATTFEYIDKNATYFGGCIIPGVEISAHSLSENTAKLPEIEIKPVASIRASNTISAMQTGIFWGYVGSVEYIIKKFKEELKIDLKVIATGGLGRIIYEHTKMIDNYDPNLTFSGLKIIYDKNKG